MVKKKSNQPASQKEVEKLLSQQTVVILSAVDEKLKKTEIRISKKIDKLITTLDRFLKRLKDLADDFVAMKLDINRFKKVIREKLGVDLL